MRHLWPTTALLFLLLAAPAHADTVGQRLASEVARTNVIVNTEAYAPPIYTEWSTACGLTRVVEEGWYFHQEIQDSFNAVPLPCYFQTAPGSDHEAVLEWNGPRPAGTFEYCEFWVGTYDYTHWRWHAYGGGCADDNQLTHKDGVRAWPAFGGMGQQASGIAQVPGTLRVSELQADTVNHPLMLEVPEACGTFRLPATRADGWGTPTTNTHCLEYGTLLKLPANQDLNWQWATPFGRQIARIAQRQGFMVSDQTHDTVAFRAENWHRPYAPWGSTDPYPVIFGGPDCATHPEWWSCYPDKNNALYGFPWADLVVAN